MDYFPGKDKLWNEEVKYIAGYCLGLGIDVGAGSRTIAPHLITNDNAVPGSDFNYSADNLNFKNNYFDFVYAGHILEHLQDVLKAVKEWIRVVKIGGYVIIVSPDKRYTPTLGMEGVDAQHKADYSFEEMRELLKLLEDVDILNKNPTALNNFSFQFVLRRVK